LQTLRTATIGCRAHEPVETWACRRSRTPARLAAVVTAALAVLGGCGGGVNWRIGSYRNAHELAERENKLTFAYFRNWYSVDCTNVEEQVLKDPTVLAETQTMVCFPLEGDYDRPLAKAWELSAVPAFVIVAPDGRVLARRQSPITRDDVLAAIRSARATWAAPRPPASSAPPSCTPPAPPSRWGASRGRF